MLESKSELREQLNNAIQEAKTCEARWRNICSNSPHGILIVDTEGTIRFTNQVATSIFGCRVEELLGKHFEIPPVAKERVQISLKSFDGRTVPVEIWQIETEWSGEPAYFVALHDVTTRVHGEQELHKLYRAMIASPSIVMITDALGTIEYVNPKFTVVTGYTFAEAVGQNPRFLKSSMVPQELYKELWETVTRGQEWRGEMINRKKNGELYYESASIAPVIDLEGKITNFVAVKEDITERKDFEAKLERFASFPQLNPNPVLEFDASGTMTFCNRAAEEIISTAGKSAATSPFIPEDMQEILRALREKKTLQYIRQVEINGLTFEELVHVVPQFNSVRIYARDITGIKQAEEKLRRSEQQLAESQKLAHLGSWEWNIGADTLTASAELYRIFGVLPEELDVTYAGIMKLVHPDDREKYERDIRTAIAEKTSYDNYHRIIRPDGTVCILNSRGTVTIDETGTPVSLIGTCQDVTERRQAEEISRNTEQKLRNVVEHSTNLFYMHTTDHILTYMSPQSRQFFDCEPENAMVRWTELITDNPVNQIAIEATQLAIDTGVRQPPYQVECIGRKGRTIWVEVNVAPIVENGKTVVIVGSLTDITERRRAEEEIERLNTDLMARAIELETANQELEAFSYTVSHDLRKPLTVINSYCQVVRELCGDKLDDVCRGYLQEAYDGTLRMNQLIEALLKFSHLAHVEPQRARVDISALAREAAVELRLAEPARRVTFRLDDGVSADGDANLLRVVLDNLLGNAWKYSAIQEEAVIEFGVTEIDGQAAFFVRDNGIGFAMAHKEKLFHPFMRLPGSKEGEGYGIGLATVERIIRRHGGKIWAEGEPGKGATFYFTLPGKGVSS